ncbi:branched-chain amino acid aminotransferase [Aestuariispira insulae]|uniref:Probable branched-chain-amino-acid aminotransferase n=1 Tax=Aestuariispira insulae TaxID=1461337 RepID=A0A3D9HXX4_9PROT|nr:branched-chain amino acid aminotransferase [Aestuariispira insulae]RED54353.1 branched-chain amino acid aminotransferase [Aestuariispira insulae]
MSSVVWNDGAWRDGAEPLLSVNANGVWLASSVFDGARAFENVAPDLDLHCQRLNRSAAVLGLKPLMSAGEIFDLAWEGIKKYPSGAELYIKPLYWAESGFVAPDPDSTRFALSISEAPLPTAAGFSACLSSYRRPSPEVAPTQAKASCLYPNAGRALQEAQAAGYDNAVMLDPIGFVAEFATANIFMVKDGVVSTPVPNGCFLNGITRQRVIALLRGRDIEVQERQITPEELEQADEIFNTGNYSKVMPVIRYQSRDLQPGPVAALARELYWEFAHKTS